MASPPSLRGGGTSQIPPSLSHAGKPSTSIYTSCKSCLDRYVALSDALSGASPESALTVGFEQETSLAFIEDACVRFKAWAINIAAFQQSHLPSSLDSRLKEATAIRQRILKILAELEVSLQTALLIVTGVEPNETWDTNSLSDCDEDGEGGNDQVVVETSELKELFAAIQTANSSLMKLSLVIRTSPSRDDYLKAATRYNLDSVWDIGHVKEKHGNTRRKQDWLLDRLGKSITRRRQYLRYREEHHWKLAQDWETVPKVEGGQEAARTIADTKATTFVEVKSLPGQEGSELGGSFGSQTSYDPTVIGESESITKLAVPRPPKNAFEGVPFVYGEPFQCPYCYTEQTVKNKTAWKNHVFRDLKPYVCTFKECDLRMFKSRNEWFAHELQNHRREWMCPSCSHSSSSRSAFQSHLTSKHNLNISGSELEALILQSEEPVDRIPISACMLCDDWETALLNASGDAKRVFLHDGVVVEPYVTLGQFRRHLGRHMEQLALFALPRHEDEEMDDDSGEESDLENDIETADAVLEALNKVIDTETLGDSEHENDIKRRVEQVIRLQNLVDDQQVRFLEATLVWANLELELNANDFTRALNDRISSVYELLGAEANYRSAFSTKKEVNGQDITVYERILLDLTRFVDEVISRIDGLRKTPRESSRHSTHTEPEFSSPPKAEPSREENLDAGMEKSAHVTTNLTSIREAHPIVDGAYLHGLSGSETLSVESADTRLDNRIARSNPEAISQLKGEDEMTRLVPKTSGLTDDTDTKPLICDACQPPKVFTWVGDLRRHNYTYHKTPAYICPVGDCRRGFHKEESMTRHISRRHVSRGEFVNSSSDLSTEDEAEPRDVPQSLHNTQPPTSLFENPHGITNKERLHGAVESSAEVLVAIKDFLADPAEARKSNYGLMLKNALTSVIAAQDSLAEIDINRQTHWKNLTEESRRLLESLDVVIQETQLVENSLVLDVPDRSKFHERLNDEVSGLRAEGFVGTNLDRLEPVPIEKSNWIVGNDERRKPVPAQEEGAQGEGTIEVSSISAILDVEQARSKRLDKGKGIDNSTTTVSEREHSQKQALDSTTNHFAIQEDLVGEYQIAGVRGVSRVDPLVQRYTSTERATLSNQTTVGQSTGLLQQQQFVDGMELEEFDDLPTSPELEQRFMKTPRERGAPQYPSLNEQTYQAIPNVGSATYRVEANDEEYHALDLSDYYSTNSNIRTGFHPSPMRSMPISNPFAPVASNPPNPPTRYSAPSETPNVALFGTAPPRSHHVLAPRANLPLGTESPTPRKASIFFKDAIGRKFSFPYELACKWMEMEKLIKQAFLHVDGIGPHVAAGYYDLKGPNGEIILPQVWDMTIEPDWNITMHMWPLPKTAKHDSTRRHIIEGRASARHTRQAVSPPPPRLTGLGPLPSQLSQADWPDVVVQSNQTSYDTSIGKKKKDSKKSKRGAGNPMLSMMGDKPNTTRKSAKEKTSEPSAPFAAQLRSISSASPLELELQKESKEMGEGLNLVPDNLSPESASGMINEIDSHFRTKLLPECIKFMNKPPKDPKAKAAKYRFFIETLTARVLLKLDMIETSNQAVRDQRRALLKEVQGIMNGLDAVLDA